MAAKRSRFSKVMLGEGHRGYVLQQKALEKGRQRKLNAGLTRQESPLKGNVQAQVVPEGFSTGGLGRTGKKAPGLSGGPPGLGVSLPGKPSLKKKPAVGGRLSGCSKLAAVEKRLRGKVF